jgi:hypothetical protein
LTDDRMERLISFFAGYFHESFLYEVGSAEAVIDTYLREGYPAREVEGLAMDVVEYADACPDDAELSERLFDELGCYYDPTAGGRSAREWMYGVASRLLRSVGASGEVRGCGQSGDEVSK